MQICVKDMDVAPLVGAWIEIREIEQERAHYPVAPLVGAWIEIWNDVGTWQLNAVAPLVGAWIEIPWSCHILTTFPSLPSWERGLKSSAG